MPGIKPVSSWILVGFSSPAPQQEYLSGFVGDSVQGTEQGSMLPPLPVVIDEETSSQKFGPHSLLISLQAQQSQRKRGARPALFQTQCISRSKTSVVPALNSGATRVHRLGLGGCVCFFHLQHISCIVYTLCLIHSRYMQTWIFFHIP